MGDHIRIKLNGKELEPAARIANERVPYEFEWVSGRREAAERTPEKDFSEVWKLADWLLIE
ncbi:hypothetical protein [Ammoniphilus sp. 3BR4]|uniref:hypothetical protein n=1 Tax=Ammoniphilus sp. 3BR4 TaxID=3158265 RepID=UPI00346789F0